VEYGKDKCNFTGGYSGKNRCHHKREKEKQK